MNEVIVDDPEDLLKQLNNLPNNFIFRGHANAAWRLESSLERLIGAGWSAVAAEKFEDRSFDEFRSKFHLYDGENLKPNSKFAWLALMQHYGIPTRLLDFTSSPYIALYFALEAYDTNLRPDFAVIALDYSAIMEQSIAWIGSKDREFRETRGSVHAKRDKVFDETVDRLSYDIAWIGEPAELNVRVDRQAGTFLVSGNRGKKIEEALAAPIYDSIQMTKFTIKASLYESVFVLLRKMNINSKSLYGDLNGLAKAIRMEMQMYAMPR